jgi:hypothetical protein
MATTIAAAFREFSTRLNISGLQESTVSTRQQNVRHAVASELNVLDSFLTGSYRRDTMITPLKEADVDIFIVLNSEYYESNGQATLLDRVKRALKRTYTTPDISRNGQAVTITFTDFTVDVVPAFNRQGGGYLIPNSTLGRWIATDPKKHVDIWIAANKAHNADLVPLIKMIKGWNKSRDVLRSFHLEVLILKVLHGIRIDDYPSAVRYVFDKLRSEIKVKVPDPAGYSDDVAAHVQTDEEMNEIIRKLDWAYSVACEAERLGNSGYISSAIDKWKSIFKDCFPAYG